MTTRNPRLELTWIGKDERPRLEPCILRRATVQGRIVVLVSGREDDNPGLTLIEFDGFRMQA